MSDKQTLSDMVEDLQIEMIALRADLQHWKNIAFKLYSPWTHMEGVEMMKAKIDKNGYLHLERAGKLRPQDCPFAAFPAGDRGYCGDWCPHFGDIPGEIRFTCGTGMSWLVELIDERKP